MPEARRHGRRTTTALAACRRPADASLITGQAITKRGARRSPVAISTPRGQITAKFSGATLVECAAAEVKTSPGVASAGTRC